MHSLYIGELSLSILNRRVYKRFISASDRAGPFRLPPGTARGFPNAVPIPASVHNRDIPFSFVAEHFSAAGNMGIGTGGKPGRKQKPKLCPGTQGAVTHSIGCSLAAIGVEKVPFITMLDDKGRFSRGTAGGQCKSRFFFPMNVKKAETPSGCLRPSGCCVIIIMRW